MNKLYGSLILMLFSLVSLPLLAAETDEIEKPWLMECQNVTGNHPKRCVGWYERDSLKGHLGFFASVIKESPTTGSGAYSSYYVGPTLAPIDGLVVGIAIGREVISNELSGTRRAAFFDGTWGKIHAFALRENGASGPWHKNTITYAVTEKFGAGVMDETFLGRGPRLEYNITKSVQLWSALLHDRDTGKNSTVFAFSISF